MIKICEAMRDHFRAYVSTNLSSSLGVRECRT